MFFFNLHFLVLYGILASSECAIGKQLAVLGKKLAVFLGNKILSVLNLSTKSTRNTQRCPWQFLWWWLHLHAALTLLQPGPGRSVLTRFLVHGAV